MSKLGLAEWFAVGVAAVWAICLLVSLVTKDGSAVSAASVPMVAAVGYVFGSRALKKNGEKKTAA